MLTGFTPRVLSGLLLFAAVILAAGCSGGSGREGDERQLTVVVVDEYTFNPDMITIKVGEPIFLTLDNSRAELVHDFTVNDLAVGNVEATRVEDANHQENFAVHVSAEAGARASVRFTATEAGDFYFFCNVPGHIRAGMIGLLRVE
ncbi:MAG: cupredoxin domain-containing protein [Tepidiformaceae bacterium]